MGVIAFLSLPDSKISLNGAVLSSVALKNRPRIPTPDVTKEGMEKENRFNLTPATLGVTSTSGSTSNQFTSSTANVASGVALMAQQLTTSYPGLNGNDMPVMGTLLLSPIKELESNSVHNTLQAGSPTTNALAKAVIPTLQSDWRTGKL